MPIYEYKCGKCGHVFEVQQSFGDDPVKTCECEGCTGKVSKVFSPPAIIFKGSGFHVNDYGKGGNGRKSSTGAGSDEAKEKKTEAKEKSEASVS